MKTFTEAAAVYRGVVFLDSCISRRWRRVLLQLLAVATVLLALALVVQVALRSVSLGALDWSLLTTELRLTTGVLCITASVLIVGLQLTFYYNSRYYRGVLGVHAEDEATVTGVTQEVATVYYTNPEDLTAGFLQSSYGQEIMLRSGVTPAAVSEYLATHRPRLNPHTLTLPTDRFLNLQDIGAYILQTDQSFKDFLFTQQITEDLFLGANEWVWRVRATYKRRQRWWSRDQLALIPGLGREFSYGIAYELRRYQRELTDATSFSVYVGDAAYANEVIENIETVLTRNKAANVLLLGESGVGTMDILIELARRMQHGESLASLGTKRMVLFDAEAFVAAHPSKEAFEAAFLKMMVHTENAGNVIMVIENLASFLSSASAFAVDLSNLLNRFLVSTAVQIVGVVDPRSYHHALEQNQLLVQHFSPVPVAVPDVMTTVRLLEAVSRVHERTHRVWFTYPAIVRVAESAEQYIVDGVMPNKAVTLLAEVAATAGQQKESVITASFVDSCVSQKTGIPIGPMSLEERETLLNLEEVLHRRVVGQDQAINAIASVMRRARAGIHNPHRPIGSFLFLGSTGVGKTETAKALAETFFGSEESMTRFDMSEFSDAAGFERFIGSPESAGALGSAVRERPYGVLLLDEFEKASPAVHDLFLQILDEGVFSDGRGMDINARNTIIIATSNAGSQLIFEASKTGVQPAAFQETVVNAIITDHVFKPELINRFDAVILFDVLTNEAGRTIALQMLEALKARIKERGFTLEITDALLDHLVAQGTDAQFGARPMRRAIQDVVEEQVAAKIIAGGLRLGETIRLDVADVV